MTDDELRDLAKRGLLIGPNESEVEFLTRVTTSPPLHDPISTPFDCAPDWLTITYDDKGLSLWQGAAIWIEKGKAHIQLRTAFSKKEKYLTYSKKEVLSHEAVHAARMTYNEPRFEEIFAYMTSPSKWRRCIGPLFRTPLESLIFVISAVIAIPLQLFFPYVALIPLLAIGFAALRLYRDYRTLKRACHTISTQYTADPLSIAFRLTDSEIAQYARGESPPTDSLRWRQIKIIS